MVNVTKRNFIEQSNDFLDHLPTSAFVAIDEEMTGIMVPGAGRPVKDQSPSQRYPILKQAPERYSIIQLGICLFHHVKSQDGGAGSWQVRRYNFYMFPDSRSSRELVLNPSAVAFLNQHKMSFDVWMKEGIPYLPVTQAEETLTSFLQAQKTLMEEAASVRQANSINQPPTIQETVRRRIELRKPQDIEFFARAMAGLREWLDGAHAPNADAANSSITNVVNAETTGKCYLLPACNSFLRRALYESINKEYPSLDLESAGREHPDQIRVWRLTAEEKVERKECLRAEAFQEVMAQKLGMWRIFEAISRVCRGEELDRTSALFSPSYDKINWENPGSILDISHFPMNAGRGRKIPLVVHNGFMDICYLLTHFHANKLPDKLPDCKAIIRSYFPCICDTKIMSTECGTAWNNEMSNLSNLFNAIVVNDGDGFLDQLQVMSTPGSNEQPDQEHEAAYDAYMTGCIYIRLCHAIRESHSSNISIDPEVEVIEKDDIVGPLTHLWKHDTQTRHMYGTNKLYQMSMYTMDLEADEDPLSRGMSPNTTYRVGGIDPSVSTRDIVRCLAGLLDRTNRQVNYEIIWVDDTTFLVAASYRPPPPQPAEEGELVSTPPSTNEILTVLQEHGRLVLEALQNRFKNETIITLEEHLQSLKEEQEEKQPENLITRVLRFFTGEPPTPKRRRYA